MTARIYIVSNAAARDIAGNDSPPRLVRANSRTSALKHVVRDTLTVELATQDDLVRLLGAGVKVEAANAEDEGAQE